MYWYDGLFVVPIDLGDGMKNKRKLAKFKNEFAFQLAFARFAEDALDRYDIEGLPETVNKRVVLQSLLWHSNVVFLDKNGSMLALPGAPSGTLNIYGDPGNAEVYTVNGMFNKNVKLYIHGSDENAFVGKTDEINMGDKYKGVMVWENKMRFPFINSVMFYAKAVADTFRTLDTVRANIKNPQIFVAEESVVNSVKKYLQDREDNVENVISSGVFDPTKVQMIPFDNKGASLNDVTALIEWYESKFREVCGIDNNSQMDKKGENLIEAEVSVNDQYTQNSVEKCIETMNECFDDVNKIFGTNIKAKRKERQNEDISGTEDSRGDNLSGSSDERPQTDNK